MTQESMDCDPSVLAAWLIARQICLNQIDRAEQYRLSTPISLERMPRVIRMFEAAECPVCANHLYKITMDYFNDYTDVLTFTLANKKTHLDIATAAAAVNKELLWGHEFQELQTIAEIDVLAETRLVEKELAEERAHDDYNVTKKEIPPIGCILFALLFIEHTLSRITDRMIEQSKVRHKKTG